MSKQRQKHNLVQIVLLILLILLMLISFSISFIPIGHAQEPSEGTANISAITNDGGFTAACQLTVKSRIIKSSVYQVDTAGRYLQNAAPNTSVSQLKADLLNDAQVIAILDAKGVLHTGGKVGTGMNIQLSIYNNV